MDFNKFNSNFKMPELHKIPEIPTFDEDCEFVDQCKYVNDNCRTGATALRGIRCDQGRINEMLENKELSKTQTIQITGSSNVQVNQQGDQSSNQQYQGISIEEMPQELLDEFKSLVESPASTNRTKWVSFLQKFTAIGGTITTLIKLYSMFTGN